MIHLTADFIAGVYEKNHPSHRRPQVNVLVIASVNYRVPQFMVDPRADLAKIKPWTWPNTWVVQMLPRHYTHKDSLMIVDDLAANTTDTQTKNRLFAAFGHLDLKDMMDRFDEHDRREAAAAAKTATTQP